VNTASYNVWMLAVTAAYMVVTTLLFVTVAYETWHKPKTPDLQLYPHRAWWDWKMVDFVLENRGPTLRNLQITSNPENLGWGNGFPEMLSSGLLISNKGIPPISSLGRGEIHRHFWQSISKDLHELDVLFSDHPEFTITVEFDNPQRILGFIGRKRRVSTFVFNKPAIAAYLTGIRTSLDVHQLARELSEIRKSLEQMRTSSS
jgi:hypothetical protein